jgi:hypothetical protein
MIAGMRAALVATVLVVLAACADTNDPQPAHVSGTWHYSEELSDRLRGLVCTDTGSYRFRQDGATFTGEYFQVGVCLGTGGGFFNTDSGRLSSGVIVGQTLRFDATPMCSYEGRLTGAPPQGVAGRGYCTLDINGTTYNFEGSWQATRTTTAP